MSPALATGIVWTLGAYLGIGLVFAISFVLTGAGRLDEVARHGTVGFRLLIIPGVAALWPLLAWRWRRGDPTPPMEHNAHRDVAGPPVPIEETR